MVFVPKIDDIIDVTVLSKTNAKVIGKNIQRPNGSIVTIRNVDTNEEWTATVRDGQYTSVVEVPPGIQNFTASKPQGIGTYTFTIKVREPCVLNDSITYQSGVGFLSVSTDCTPNSNLVLLKYDGITYNELLSNDNSTTIFFPVVCGAGMGEWTLDGMSKTIDTQFSCDGLVRVIVNFSTPANLNLFVEETKSAPPIYYKNCNFSSNAQSNSCDNDGGKLLIDIASRADSINTQYYEAKISNLKNSKYIVAMVEYHDRNSEYAEKLVPTEFCGSGRKAQVPYTMRWYDGKSWSKRNFIIRPIQCGSIVPKDLYYSEREQSIRLSR